MTGQPQDFMPKVQKAVGLQAANLLQKAQLDMMATKIVLVLKELKRLPRLDLAGQEGRIRVGGSDEYESAMEAEDALNEISRTLSMTREETTAARASFVYPDERIQAVIDKATEEIAAILLEDVG